MRSHISPSGSSTAVIAGGDGRMTVHNLVRPGLAPRLYVERGLLTEKYLCLCWSASEAWIGVCLESGGIVVWDVKRGIKVGSGDRPDSWSQGSAGCCLTWSGNTIYACSAKEQCLGAWHVSDSGCTASKAVKADKRGVTALAARPTGGMIACGSTRLRLIRFEADVSKRKTVKGAAQASEMTAIAWTSDGRFVASIAKRERAVLIVDCDGALPVVAVSLEAGTSHSLALRCVGRRTIKLDAAVTCDDGAARVCRCAAIGGATEWTVSSSRSVVKRKSGVADVAIVDDRLLVVCVDDAAKPTSSTLDYQRDGELVNGSLDEADRRQVPDPVQNGLFEEKGIDVVPALEAAGPEPLAPLPSLFKKRTITDVDGEEALEDRLAALEAETTEREKMMNQRVTAYPDADANSLATALAQAVRSNDDAMLESILQHREDSVLEATIDRLDASVALPLLAALTVRLDKKPARALHLARWTNLLLIKHASILAKQPGIFKVIASLDILLQKRAAALPHFLALSGRLELALKRQNEPGTSYKPKTTIIATENPTIVHCDDEASAEQKEADFRDRELDDELKEDDADCEDGDST